MDSLDDIKKRYIESMLEREKEELSNNAKNIDAFIELCKSNGLILSKENIKYIHTIGVVAHYPNILSYLNPKIKKDKEELVKFDLLNKLYSNKGFASGFLYDDNYIAMAHPFFRRGLSENAVFAPRFIDIFWRLQNKEMDLFISLDFNRVRINVDNVMYMELDTWYGAKFNSNIKLISDGISKLRPPLDIDTSMFFNNAYSLDTIWETKNGIKTFQAEEFKSDNIKILIEGEKYFPVRYIHAEYDLEAEYFRHFDGALHLYTEIEYFERRDSDLNYNNKKLKKIKPKSIKLFKINGKVTVETWVELTSHFFAGNPLIIEYFEGKYPERLREIIEKIRTKNK